MKNGIIYPVINFILISLRYLNLVEGLKWFFRKLNSDDKKADKFGADTFIIVKWLFVALIWEYEVKSYAINIIIYYLILTNLYTYFYYHVWEEKEDENGITSTNTIKEILQRQKRRFIHLLQAVSFNILSFAYLIAIPFSHSFHWENGYSTFKDSMFFSLSQTLTVDYNCVEPIDSFASQIITLETLVSFIFLTIVLSTSVPEKELN